MVTGREKGQFPNIIPSTGRGRDTARREDVICSGAEMPAMPAASREGGNACERSM